MAHGRGLVLVHHLLSHLLKSNQGLHCCSCHPFPHARASSLAARLGSACKARAAFTMESDLHFVVSSCMAVHDDASRWTAGVKAAACSDVDLLSDLLTEQSLDSYCDDALLNALGGALLAAVCDGQDRSCSMLLAWAERRGLVHRLVLARDASEVNTPLMLAAKAGQERCMQALLDFSPEKQVAAVNKSKQTALHMTAEFGHAGCIPLLLAHSPHSQLAAVNEHGLVALHLAAYYGHADCIARLLTHCLQSQLAAVGLSKIALHWAAFSGHAGCIAKLLAHFPETQLAAAEESNWTALHWVATQGHAHCIPLLLAHRPESQLAAVDESGGTALHLAARSGHNSCIPLLLAHIPEAQLLATGRWGATALLEAAHNGHADCLQLLMSHYTPPQGHVNNALSCTLERHGPCFPEGQRMCVELLLSKGARLPPNAPATAWARLWPLVHGLTCTALMTDMVKGAVA